MSRASTYHDKENKWVSGTLPSYSCPYMSWTMSSDSGIDTFQDHTESYETQTFLHMAPTFDVFHFFDIRAGLVAASFCDAIQLFTQASNIFKYQVNVSSLDQGEEGLDLKEELLVNMPPRSKRKVVMRARYSGRGKPLAYLDPLPED